MWLRSTPEHSLALTGDREGGEKRFLLSSEFEATKIIGKHHFRRLRRCIC